METILFKNVTFSYPNSERSALDNINVSIERSQFVVICGKSGCGKSTLLKHIKKSMIPFGEFQGEILYNGQAILTLDDKTSAAEIGFVQQSHENQVVTNKVWNELAFGLESLGLSSLEIRRRVAEMSSFFGIQTWFHRDTSELSGGQMQLLNLASIMVMQPKILILDEPTSQLDPIAASEFLGVLSKINRELGTTIILSEHRLEEVFPMADMIIVMDNGKITDAGNLNEVGMRLSTGSPKHPMFLGLPTPMKIYAEVNKGGKCPVTVRDGRIWLDNLIKSPPDILRRTKETTKLIEKKRDKKDFLIELKDVWYRYEKNSDDVIKGLSMNIKKGEWFCLLGGNGVGKTTVLKIMSGLIKPYRGKVTINGTEIKANKLTMDSNIGILPQNPQVLFTEITAQEELFDMILESKDSNDRKLEQVDNMLKLLDLENQRKTHPYDLSGGEQQRLALGKIMLLNPTILFMDEPTKGMDPFFKTVFAEIIKKLQANGVTIFMITHDIEFCAEYADRCGLFFDGSLISSELTHEFFEGNSFYTTVSNRMSRHIFDNAVTYREVVELCGKSMTD